MKKCNYCGTENLDIKSNCSNCGSPLKESSTPKVEQVKIHNTERNVDRIVEQKLPDFSIGTMWINIAILLYNLIMVIVNYINGTKSKFSIVLVVLNFLLTFSSLKRKKSKVEILCLLLEIAISVVIVLTFIK